MDSIEHSSSSADSEPFDERGPAFIFKPRRNIWLGLLGSGLLLIGVFLPIFSMPIVGGVNYLHNGRIDGLFVFFIAISSGFVILFKLFRVLILTGTVALMLMCFTLCHYFAQIGGLRDEMAQSNDIFKGPGETILSAAQIRWGWVPLLAGGFLILAAGVMPHGLLYEAGRIIPANYTSTWATLVVAGALMAGTVMAAYWLAPDFLRNLSVPVGKPKSPDRSRRPFDRTSTNRITPWRTIQTKNLCVSLD